ncbi:MAG: hypothetical protein IJ048_11945 [Clostridia bacterium]|nr:hypothetical protein [Clostridia bacterium]
MSGLFNSFYYGKAGKADFTPDQLPKTRVELFFSMLRVRFSGLIGLNLLYFLFSLPTVVWTFINYLAIMTSSGFDMETGEQLAEAAVAGSASTYIFQWLIGMIPCLMISSVGRMGLAYTLRNWARDDHSFVMSDIKDAIRGNWKTAVLIGLISGASLFVGYICNFYYSGMAADNLFWMVPQALVIIFLVIWWMATMLIYPMAVTYDMKLRALVQNSVIMVLARLPFSVLFWALPTFIPIAVVYFIPSNIPLLVVGLYYLLIGYALYQFMTISYANSCFDRFLNPRIDGADVNKGLRDPAYDDEDETVTEEDIKNL